MATWTLSTSECVLDIHRPSTSATLKKVVKLVQIITSMVPYKACMRMICTSPAAVLGNQVVASELLSCGNVHSLSSSPILLVFYDIIVN